VRRFVCSADIASLVSIAVARSIPRMDRAEEMTAEISTPWTPGSRTILAAHVVVLAAVSAALLIAREGFLQLRRESDARADAQRAQTTEVAQKVASLDAEVTNLRQIITSRTAEDVIFLKIMVLKPNIDGELARRIARSVHRLAEQYRRDPDLLLAIMAVESNFNPQAVSPAGATGLMQVMPHWKQVLAIEGDLRDPDVSIRSGLQILGFYENMYRDLDMALTAYNRGPGPVDNALVRGRDPTNDYAPRVKQQYERLKKLTVSSTEL
jgi:soluble lytic murein transglycosylase-like protein